MIVWPPDYLAEYQKRFKRLEALRAGHTGWRPYYSDKPVEWISDWSVTYDPRNAGSKKPTTMPFILFPRQVEMVQFLHQCVGDQQNGLFEKCRDMGATWVCAAFSVWLWLLWDGAAVGWGSRKEQLVDKLGDPDSIFEKMRIIIRNLPKEMRPVGFNPVSHMPFMKITNPENGSSITGESGDNIGRGGRKLIYFKDESAHYERPEKIEAALADNTRCQIDISSVNGLGNVFHRRRENGQEWTPGSSLATHCANVFIMDWRDHPDKTQEWYDQRKAKAESDGLTHIFAQEVDRDYSAAVEGVIIPAHWVAAAIDADKRLGLDFEAGRYSAGLDVADSGGDKNALALVKGSKLRTAEDWGAVDTGATARKAIGLITGITCAVQYDCIGVGAGVKAETNRLSEEGIMPKGLQFIPWSAARAPLRPDARVIPGDKESPLNKDFYANIKAQGWWELRRRFERTYRAINEGVQFDVSEMICLDSAMPNLATLRKELSQATRGETGNRKLVVNKTPEGTKSPNLADAVVMAYWPITPKAGIMDVL